MDINSNKYGGITQWETLSGTEGPNVPHFFVDKGFALNRNTLRPFGGSKLSVKKKSVQLPLVQSMKVCGMCVWYFEQ